MNCFLLSSSSYCNRGFNDAVNGFNDDGWSIMHCNGAEDIIVAVNSTKHLNSISDSLSFLGGVLCAKASMLVQVSSYTSFLKSSLLQLWQVFLEHFTFFSLWNRMFLLRFWFDF